MANTADDIRKIAKDVYRVLGSGYSEQVYDRAMQVGLRLAKLNTKPRRSWAQQQTVILTAKRAKLPLHQVKPPKMGHRHPNSLAALRPAKPGEVRNPLGINRRRPYSDANAETSLEPLPEPIRLKYNREYRRTFAEVIGENADGSPRVRPLGKKAVLFHKGITWAKAISIQSHVKALADGDITTINSLRDGVEGAPRQRVEVIGGEGTAAQQPRSYTVVFVGGRGDPNNTIDIPPINGDQSAHPAESGRAQLPDSSSN
jgi:hypothetical protein